MYLLKYKIEGWSEDINKFIDEGLTCGKSLTDVVKRLENYYGGEINKLSIEFIGKEDEPYLLNEQYKINER